MTEQEIIKLRQQVRQELHQLPPSIYPYFSHLAKNDEGMNKAEAMVLAYIAKNAVGVLTAIAQLETEYEAG